MRLCALLAPAMCLDMNMCQKKKLENKTELSTLLYIYIYCHYLLISQQTLSLYVYLERFKL